MSVGWSKYQKKAVGFTMVELLTAAALLAVFMAMLLPVTGALLETWNRAAERASAAQAASLALDSLECDLESAATTPKDGVWLMMDTFDYEGRPGAWLRFFAAPSDRPRQDAQGRLLAGDVCAVSYWLASVNPLPERPNLKTSALFRSVINSEETFASYLGQDDTGHDQLPAKKTGDFFSAEKIGPANTFREALLAANIVSFQVTFYVAQAGSFSPVAANPAVFYSANLPVPPAFADVSLTILTEQGQALLDALAAGEVKDRTRDEIINQHGLTFTRRINFFAVPR